MNEKIIPFGDNVVVEIVDQKKSTGGIIIPDKAKSNQRDAIVGKVVGVGAGRMTEYGILIKPVCAIGDYVLLGRGTGTEIELDTRNKDSRTVRILRDVELPGSVEQARVVQLGLFDDNSTK